MVILLVAAFAVHWENGWQAIADPGSDYVNDRVVGATDRLAKAKAIPREHANYEWLTGRGSLVMLNNGIEFAITYFIMVLSLFYTGGGRYVSIDYWLSRCFPRS